jgi:ketosteroid isomerase-like protein
MIAGCRGKEVRAYHGGDLYLAAVDGVDELIERYHLALGEFMKGNSDPAKGLWSHRDDVSLTNPQGSAAHGWHEVSEAMERAASTRRDGKFVGYETVAKHVTAELAYVVELERLEAKVYGEEDVSPYTLRVTMIFRPEDGAWKVLHRHADQVATTRPAESVLQR